MLRLPALRRNALRPPSRSAALSTGVQSPGGGPGRSSDWQSRQPDIDPASVADSTGSKGRSHDLTGDPAKAPAESGSYVKMTTSRSNLRACGWVDGDFRKPIITIGSPWSNALPCNNHLRELCLLYTSPSPRDQRGSRMPSSA